MESEVRNSAIGEFLGSKYFRLRRLPPILTAKFDADLKNVNLNGSMFSSSQAIHEKVAFLKGFFG